MDKMLIKRCLRMVERDLKYYMEEYNMSQKDSYEIIYQKYFVCMRLTQPFVEVEARGKIHNMMRGEENEN